MLLLRSFGKPPDRSTVHLDGSRLHSLSFRGRALNPNTRIDVRLLGPCFKTGRLEPLRQRPRYKTADHGPTNRMTSRVITPPEGGHVPKDLSPTGRADAGPTDDECTGQKPG